MYMKKIKSLINKSDVKSFILGTALAIIISFGITGVLATNQSGDTYRFLGQDDGIDLVNRIGSLTVGQENDGSWILSGNSCLTTGGESELQSCLHVSGSGAFSKLTVLDMPVFIQNSSLFLNDDGDGAILSGLPTGFVIDDFIGTDDSIMTTSLQFEEGGVIAPRNLDEQRQLCADPTTGKLKICDDPVYHWEVNSSDWTDCELNQLGSCSGGTYTTGGGGSCTGIYYTNTCDGTFLRAGLVDWYGAWKAWNPSATYRYDDSTAYVSGESGNYPKYKTGTTYWKKKNYALDDWDYISQAHHKSQTLNCTSGTPNSQSDCTSNAWTSPSPSMYTDYREGTTTYGGHGGCGWNSHANSCSNLGITSESNCSISPHTNCTWEIDTTTGNCSDLDNHTACTWGVGMGDCTWDYSTGSQENTYVCKDDSGIIVDDTYCSDLIQSGAGIQDCQVDAVCGDRNGNPLPSDCDAGLCNHNGSGCESCAGLAEDGCSTTEPPFADRPSCAGENVTCAG